MPQMKDPRFDHSVVFVCGHDKNGAMGIVINRHISDLQLSGLLEQMEVKVNKIRNDPLVHFGGPIEMGRGFVLHTSDYLHKTSVKMKGEIVLTANMDILKILAEKDKPRKFILALGYAGWSAGQLEKEIQSNSWLQVEPDEELVFSRRLDKIWQKSLDKIGINLEMLSDEAGHA